MQRISSAFPGKLSTPSKLRRWGNIDGKDSNGDSDCIIPAAARWLSTTAALTAPRVWTLPAASALNAGQLLVISDAVIGGVTATNKITITRAGADTINGGTTFDLDIARGVVILHSDGVSAWGARLVVPFGTSAGQAIRLDSAAKLPAVDGSALTKIGLRPFFSAGSTAGTTLGANGFTKIAFDVEVVDSDACYDPTTNYRFTPNVAGKYYVFASLSLAGAPAVNALFAADIYKNGVRYQQWIKYVPTTETSSLPVFAIVDMNGTTDYLECFGYNGMAANTRTIDNSAFANAFGAFRIGA